MLGLAALWRLRHSPLDFYSEQQRRQGDCARLRLGPYRLRLLFHPREIEATLTAGVGTFIRFERAMRVLAQWNGESLLIQEGDAWRARRRQILPAFARRRMTRFAERSVALATSLAQTWASRCGDDGTVIVDSDQELTALALDIALDAMFGRQAEEQREAIARAVAIFSDVAYSETSGPWRTPLWQPFGRGPKKRWAMETIDRIVRRMIAERVNEGSADRGDLLSILLEGDRQMARDDAVTLLVAGHETSGATLCWFGYLLAQSPKALMDAQTEIDFLLEGRAATLDDYDKLVFLRAALDETLRLFPPAYGLFPRRAQRDTQVGDAAVTRGDIVLLTPWVTHRDPRWFEAPDEFRPHRFLDRATWPTYAYFPFGAGPRSCIGHQFALVEITLAMATLLQRFTPQPADAPVKPEAKFSLRPRGGLVQRWSIRAAR
jgi:enediyne biosynthesis protein E7